MPTLFAPPKGLTYPVKRSPLWNNLHQVSASGKDNPIQLYSYPRWKWEIDFSFLRTAAAFAPTEWQYLVGFYNAVGGSARSWLWNDVDDTTVTDQSFGTGNGSTTQFALVRTLGGFIEPVFSPVGAPTIKKNGVTLATPADYSIGTAGLVTFTVAPAAAAALTWTGTYNWVVRFDDDNVDFSKFASGFYDLQGVKFTSLKLTPA